MIICNRKLWALLLLNFQNNIDDTRQIVSINLWYKSYTNINITKILQCVTKSNSKNIIFLTISNY